MPDFNILPYLFRSQGDNELYQFLLVPYSSNEMRERFEGIQGFKVLIVDWELLPTLGDRLTSCGSSCCCSSCSSPWSEINQAELTRHTHIGRKTAPFTSMIVGWMFGLAIC